MRGALEVIIAGTGFYVGTNAVLSDSNTLNDFVGVSEILFSLALFNYGVYNLRRYFGSRHETNADRARERGNDYKLI